MNELIEGYFIGTGIIANVAVVAYIAFLLLT
jgi:hypothetical protein